MSVADAMVGEFTHESIGTRKMLERIPEDKLSWKPHVKSMTMGRLAAHLAELPEWSKTILNEESFDMATSDHEPHVPATKPELLDLFDKNVAAFKESFSGQSDERLFQNWKLEHGGHLVAEMPRVAWIRSFILSHIIHHRGQLSVYLRENDVPLPALYGPTADENV